MSATADKPTTHEDSLIFKRRVIVVFCSLIFTLVTLGTIARNVFAPMPIGVSIMEIVALTTLGGLALAAKFGGWVRPVGHTLCLINIVAIFAIASQGLGFVSPAISFLFLNPILATVLLHKRWGLFYGLVSLGTIAGLYIYEQTYGTGLVAPIESIFVAKLVIFSTMTILILVLMQMYEAKRQTYERELASQVQKTEDALRIRSLFIANMSHEFRTPLNGIIGSVDLLSDQQLNSEAAERLAVIKDSGTMLLNLVNEILDYTKLETGQSSVDLTYVDIRQELASIIKLLDYMAQERSIAITLAIDEQVPLAIETDVKSLRQILTNLIHNAIKFCDSHDVTVKLDYRKGRHEFRVQVIDQGVGIDLNSDQLFQPFSQLAHDVKLRKQGTGLGLALSKKLAQVLDGDLGFQPNQPKGSIFTLTLSPRTGGAELLQTAHRTEDVLLPSDLRVLVVDDNDVSVVIMAKLLAKLGIEADVAENGQVAVDKASANSYDVIFMDIHMPVLNGHDASRAIRDDSRSKDAFIVSISAGTAPEDRAACLASGMNDFLDKPITKERLHAMLVRSSNKSTAA